MANELNIITKYLTKAIDSVIVAESKTQLLLGGNKFVDVNFNETGYVKIMSMLMDGLSDYYRVNEGQSATDYTHIIRGTGQGYKLGDVQATWEIYKLRYDRGRQFAVDRITNEQTASLVIGNLLTEFTRTKVVPEIDAVRFSTIASYCNASLGNYKEETIAENTILKTLNGAFEWLSQHEVPTEDQVIFVSPVVMAQIRNTTELVRYLTQGDYKVGDNNFTMEKYMGRPIVEVPSSRFITNVEVGDNGYFAGTNSKQINFMVVSRKAVIPIVKFEQGKIWGPDQVFISDSYLVNYRIFHDTIIPKNKVIASYVSVSSTAGSTYSQRLDVALVEGSATNAYRVSAFYTTPAGILGRLVAKQSAMALNSTQTPDGSTIKLVELDTDVVEASATTAYFALIDANDKVVATTPAAITLTKKK